MERESEHDGEGNSEKAVLNALERPKEKGVQWSFRTCPSLVQSLAISFLSKTGAETLLANLSH